MSTNSTITPILLGWYPTGHEPIEPITSASTHDHSSTRDRSSSRTVEHRINPKYLIPQCFRETRALVDPCICRCSLPEWVSPQNEHDALFPEAPQGLTPSLVLVRVTPGVWAWSTFVRMAVESRGSASKLLPFQAETLYELIQYWCRKLYASKELDEAMADAERRLKIEGTAIGDLLPQPDEGLISQVRFHGCEPWDGYDRWASKVMGRDGNQATGNPVVADVDATLAPRARRRARPETPSLI